MTTARVDDAELNPVYRSGPFTVQPFNRDSRVVWEQRHHVVCGISPGNSYFQLSLLTDLLGWLCKEFDRVDVILPDSALEDTFLALGYEPHRAAKKARREISTLRNRVIRAWEDGGGPGEVDGLHHMSDLTSDTVYQAKLAECEQALKEDPALRETCVEMSRGVLAARGFEGSPTDDQIERAMRYLIAELPFFLASSDIFGVPTSLNFYHRTIPLAELIFSGQSLIKAPSRQAFATIRPDSIE